MIELFTIEIVDWIYLIAIMFIEVFIKVYFHFLKLILDFIFRERINKIQLFEV